MKDQRRRMGRKLKVIRTSRRQLIIPSGTTYVKPRVETMQISWDYKLSKMWQPIKPGE